MPAHAFFFPAAAAYAAVAVPASVFAMLGLMPALPGLGHPVAHGHELLFGFALAVVAGHQLGPTPRPFLLLLAITWIVGRATFVFAPAQVTSAVANGAFAALLAFRLVPRLVGRAKKARNRALPAMLAAVCAAAVAFAIAGRTSPGASRDVLVVAVLLFASLMLFVGGRIIAPAAAGAFYRRGGNLGPRVQPWLEATLVILMLVAVAAASAGARSVAGIAALAASAVAITRMGRWRLWRIRAHREVACLGVGYGWLCAGLALSGIALLRGDALVTAMHAITIGAMGTLSLNVMAIQWLRWSRQDPGESWFPVPATTLAAVAALARLGADAWPAARTSMLVAAALAWSLAYLLLLALMARARANPAAAAPTREAARRAASVMGR